VSRTSARAAPLALVAAGGALAVIAVAIAGRDGHDFTGRCGTCHAEEPGPGSALLVSDVSTLCLSCHADQAKLSHPVEMTPSMEVPDGWPLDPFGRVTCVTCHRPHGPGPAFLLRADGIGERFCRSCHADLLSGLALHKSAGVSAHMGPRFTKARGDERLDPVSLSCIGCHDSSVGRETGMSPADGGVWEHGRAVGLTHPVGVSQRDAAHRNPASYRAEQSLPPEIRLFDGRVGCATCHSPFSDRKFQVVYPNDRSRLCLSCHRK
jgi:predicted CXXCH cytochrome family protein